MQYISCKNCHSIFQISQGSIGANGRMVRCGECNYEWIATADEISSSQKDIEKNLKKGRKAKSKKPLKKPVTRSKTGNILRAVYLFIVLFLLAAIFFGYQVMNIPEQNFQVEKLSIEQEIGDDGSIHRASVKIRIQNKDEDIHEIKTLLIVAKDLNDNRIGIKTIVLDVPIAAGKAILVPVDFQKSGKQVFAVKVFHANQYVLWLNRVFHTSFGQI